MKEKYELVVGLEVHVQLSTQSKIFSTDANQYGSLPNTNISTLTLGHPGTLPKLNKVVVEYAIKMGIACHCEINRYNFFDRKSYFYPDLPKGYQTTQDKTPICKKGYICIDTEEEKERKIYLNRIHLEEDAGKSLHLSGYSDTMVDFNRAGVPLIEIVSEPVIRTPQEAYSYLTTIRKLVRYLEISDGNMEEGSLRCDANISIREKGETRLGNKTEIKNINSFRNVQRAILYEWGRQAEELEKGMEIAQETRTFNASNGETLLMRMKETMNDYRYFPDPDLPPFEITDKEIKKIREEMPPLPQELSHLFQENYRLSPYDAHILTEEKSIALYFKSLCEKTKEYKIAANWVNGPIKSYLNELHLKLEDLSLPITTMVEVIEMIAKKQLSFSVATQKLFPQLLKEPTKKPYDLALQLDILQEENEKELLFLIEEIMEHFPDKVKAYRNGKKGLLGMLMGELMKKSKGKINPKKASQLLQKKLDH